MIQINRVLSPRFDFTSSQSSPNNNRVTLVVGDNGTGKTELLSGLARSFKEGRLAPGFSTLEWTHDTHTIHRAELQPLIEAPAKVIAHTLSPFSRFPAEVSERNWMADLFEHTARRARVYACTGIHQSTRISSAHLGRTLLEESLFRLSKDPTPIKAMAQALRFLGYQSDIHLRYEFTRSIGASLFSAHLRGEPSESALSRRRDTSEYRRLQRFALENRVGMAQLSALLDTSFERARPHLEGRSTKRLLFKADFERFSIEYPTLQALSSLRVMGLITLRGCEIRRGDGLAIDLAHASSGQQHLLCSMFGLSASLEPDSLVLIDEPELSLHPKWQSDYIEQLNEVLRSTKGCHVILATHSPIIVSRGHELGFEVVTLGAKKLGGVPGFGDKGVAHSIDATLINDFEAPLEDSSYMADELFRLVAGAEEDDFSREAAKRRLLELDALYGSKSASKTSELIRKALSAVTEG